MFWGMDAAAGLGVFLDLHSLITVTAGIAKFIITDKILNTPTPNGWGQCLRGIGLIFLIAGSIGMLVNLEDPRAMRPAMAWGLLSLFYCLLPLIYEADCVL